MSSILKQMLAGFALAIVLAATSSAQNVTTATVNGAVANAQGAPLPGVTVVAVHEPSGTRSTAITNPQGLYSIRGLIVGGPFTVTATPPGETPISVGGVVTALGAETDVNLRASTTIVQMADFTVTGEQIDLDSGATGAGGTLDNRRLLAQPSVSRSFQDLIKVNPYVSMRSDQRITALGQNLRFNSITVDGARVNDQYGLNLSGLSSFRNPFSVDAIEQVSVALAPYDVRRSGFTGTEVNVVTKRGTNTFSGSGYYIYTDMKRQGPDKSGTTAGQRSLFYQRTSGGTLGGPIIKNRLFFFANYERFTEDSIAANPAFYPDETVGKAVLARVKALTSIDMGTHEGGGTMRQTDTKRMVKLDWNIIPGHRATWRYSDTKGTNPNTGNFNSTSFSVSQAASPTLLTTNGVTALSSNFYVEKRIEKVVAGQINSDWSPVLKTQINYARSSFDDPSVPPVNFPSIRIFNFPGTSRTGTPITADAALNFGTNESRQGNWVQTKTESYGANADYTWRQFTLSGGIDHEKTSFLNLFRQGSYGVFDYASPTDFINDNVRGFTRAIVQTGTPVAETSEFEQTGFFGQGKWDVSQRFNLTAGVRYDDIGAPTPVLLNPAFTAAFGYPNTGTPDGTSRLAGRFGFNYALDRERTTQVRGGVGEFLGRLPWVFLSNSYGNSGVGRFTQILTQSTTPTAPTLASYLATQFDPNNPIGTTATDPGTDRRAINLVDNKLSLPAVIRGNIALDRKLPTLSANLTLEYIQTKALSAFYISNENIRATTIGADGRQRYAGAASVLASARIPAYANVFRVRNVHDGESKYFSVQLARPLKNSWGYSASYTHGRALDVQNFGSFTASSNWTFNAVFNQNVPQLAHSDYEIRDRIQGSFSKEFRWLGKMLTTASLYYEGKSGTAYSWVYSGDLNGDGLSGNDLIAIPTGPTDSRFDFSGMTAAQQTAYFSYLASQGLDRYAGGYAPRNSYNQPWQNRLDLRLVQEIPIRGRISVELFMDFINFGSWISRDLFSYIEELPSPQNTGLTRVLGNATYNAAGQVRPTATFDVNNAVTLPTTSIVRVDNFDTRWKMQFGSKIKF